VKNTRQLERELTAVLHRHAEDAMKHTNTLAEHQKLLSVVADDQARTGPRRRWVAGGVAAAAVAAVTVGITVSSLNIGEDPSSPPVAQAPDSTRSGNRAAAEGFAAAFVDHNPAAAASYLAPGTEEPSLDAMWQRDSAWAVEYQMKPCTKKYIISDSTVFNCPYAMHLLGSRAVGEGPFRGNILEVVVHDGKVTRMDTVMPFETNGMGQHLDSVHTWVAENHPTDKRFLFQDEQAVRPGEWPRWTQLWKQYIREYIATTNQAG
jgi:hypothetical protein